MEEREKLKKKEEEKKVKEITQGLWIVTGVALFASLVKSPYIVPLILLFAILLHSEQGKSFLENIIKNYKTYKLRISLALGGLVLLAVIVVSAYFIIEGIKIERKRIQAEEETRIEAEIKENYPEPEITIISNLEHQEDAEKYLLEFTATGADEAFVGKKSSSNLEKVENNEGVYLYTLSLDKRKNEFEIIVRNKYKKSSLEFVITRDLTKEEREEEIYYTLKWSIDAIFSDPELEYILDSDALLDKWERGKAVEVANEYGISVNQLNEIYARVFEEKMGY